MSAAARSGDDPSVVRPGLRTFELEYAFDDPEDPSEVTVFPSSIAVDHTTHWLTIDVEHAVPLDEVR